MASTNQVMPALSSQSYTMLEAKFSTAHTLHLCMAEKQSYKVIVNLTIKILQKQGWKSNDFFLFSEIFISLLDRLQFESKYKINSQGWKDALYLDKSILNTTQQTGLRRGKKWERNIVPCGTGLTVVIFHSSRHSQCFISQISKCDVSQLSGVISQYSHDRPIFQGSWAHAYLFFTWPGPRQGRDMAVKTIIIQTWVNTLTMTLEAAFSIQIWQTKHSRRLHFQSGSGL